MTKTAATAAAVFMFLLTTAHSQEPRGSIEQLSGSAVLSAILVNQRAILKMAERPNSCQNVQRVGNAEQEETKEWLDRSLKVTMDALMKAQHQHLKEVLVAVMKNSQDNLEDFRKDMRRQLIEVREVQQQCMRKPEADGPEEDEPNLYSYSRFHDVLHNDSNPSLCHGDRTLVGTTGSLTVKKSGNYWPNTQCSWTLVFPRRSTVTIWWNYIDLEASVNCVKDVVEVRDLSQHSKPVYGKHCGIIPAQNLQQHNLIVHGTNSLLVSFKSDVSGERTGFSLQYHAH